MSKKNRRIITSNPEANKLIADMTEEEYREWSQPYLKPYLNIFDEEFPKELKEEVEE